MKKMVLAAICAAPFMCDAQKEFRATKVEDLLSMRAADVMASVRSYDKDSFSTYTFSYMDAAPQGWVMWEDVVWLIKLIRSEDAAKCMVSMFSSLMPDRNEHSTVGGIAMDMIDAYRNNEQFPPKATTCTATDKQRADNIEKWWKTETKK